MSLCLSRTSGFKSRTEWPRKTKIGTEVAHVTGDSDTTFKVKRSKVKVTRPLCSPPCWRVMRLQRWTWERVGCGKLLLRCRLLGGAEGRGHIYSAARLQLVNFCFPSLWKTATDCCRTEQQIQGDAWGSAHTARVTEQCLHMNCLQIILKKQWPPNSPNFNPLHVSCLGSDAQKFWKLHLSQI